MDNFSQMLQELISVHPQSSHKPAHERIFCSRNGNVAINAKLHGGTIFGVPVDERKAGDKIFSYFLNIDRQKKLTERRPVLCNVGTKGTGKSV